MQVVEVSVANLRFIKNNITTSIEDLKALEKRMLDLRGISPRAVDMYNELRKIKNKLKDVL